MCFSLEEDVGHEHTRGYILFCNLCWWKDIYTINDELIYYSFKHCPCDVKLHQTTDLQTFKYNRTGLYLLFYARNYRSCQTHLYIYPHKYEDDYDIFNICPIKKRSLTYPPVHGSQICFNCRKKQNYCENAGYAWFCHSCHINQFEMIEDTLYFTINPTIHHAEKYISSIAWQCKKCNKLQVNFFKDRNMRVKKMTCLHSN